MATAQRWTAADIPDLTGKTAIVTGANRGLGYETCRGLAAHGAWVIMACRDMGKGEMAAAGLRAQNVSARLEVMALDLADLSAIRRFADTFLANHDTLDILCNNAGVMAIPYRQTVDGFEMQFGTNHLGTFALTGRLLPAILAAQTGRVVTVSSYMHRQGKIDTMTLGGGTPYNKWGAYSQSKLANLLFAYELQRRFTAAGCQAISVAAHPGYAATNLQGVGPRMAGARLDAALMWIGNHFAQSATVGALPELYAATAPDVQGGDYIGPTGLMGMRGYPGKVHSSTQSYDLKLADDLWTASEQLTGVRYAF